MKNTLQCNDGLLYPSFSVIQMQTFCSENLIVKPDSDLVVCVNTPGVDEDGLDQIDCQIFTRPPQFYSRYSLKGFKIRLELNNKKGSVLKGYVKVRAIRFFNNCMQLSYRIMVPDPENLIEGFCETNTTFGTNELISVASLAQKAEYWDVDEKTGRQILNGNIFKDIQITEFPLDASSQFSGKGESLVRSEGVSDPWEEAMRRYRCYFDMDCQKEPESLHTFIDVDHTISHKKGKYFSLMQEAEVIEHIETAHSPELIGLMTLYPYEWPYRMESSLGDVCGKNIAIDTDDLVLTNHNVSLVIGTYGSRDGEAEPAEGDDQDDDDPSVNWQKHLARRNLYHICWPEYYTLVEMIQAKKHIINYAISKYIKTASTIADHHRYLIEQNAKMTINLSHMIMQLDAMRYLRYQSHKHMYKLAEQNMGVPQDEEYLDAIISKVDNSLDVLNDNVDHHQSRKINRTLMLISVASLFGVLMNEAEIPFIKHLNLSGWSVILGSGLVMVTFVLIVGMIVTMIRYAVAAKQDINYEPEKIRRKR